MQEMKDVRFGEVESVMKQMMKVPILRIAEKREMLNISNHSNDPNIIMDLRHKTIGESPPVSVTKSAILAEVTRMIMNEEAQALYRKREQDILACELKKFQKSLSNGRPRFRGPGCTRGKRKFLDNLDDRDYEELWKMAPRRVKVRVKDITSDVDPKRAEGRRVENSHGIETIKVTIKDKSIEAREEDERDAETLRRSFEIWTLYAREGRRLRELNLKIRENVANRTIRRYFVMWKERTENSKLLASRRREEVEITDERKIEMFVNAINERQKKMAKKASSDEVTIPKIRDVREIVGVENAGTITGNRNAGKKIVHVVEPPALNRLNAQKKIIAEQRIKLAEQNRIIEELRIKRMEADARKAGMETMSVAKEALAHCGQRTRRTLVQLMREEGCRDKTLLEPPRVPSPPRFLARMAARAAARRERVRRAEEERRRKLDELRAREEAARREEEENRKRLQLEAQREAKRIREEQERKRARELERLRRACEMADNFYRKYLMRRYIMDPLVSLIELKRGYARLALEHHARVLLRKCLNAWRTQARAQQSVKLELAIGLWRRNCLWYSFKKWHEVAKHETKKIQVAMDFYEFRLQERCIRVWYDGALKSRMRETENTRIAEQHALTRMKRVCFARWRKFLKISDDVRETDRTRNSWRALVQRLVPDFDPKQRGVIIDD